MKKLSDTLELIYKFLASRGFFVAIVAFFIIEALWIAFSAVYSLPYDEFYHMGIIDFYSHHWSPFITSQPEAVSIYGDLTRLPSYLYHYLMSFPYRLAGLVTDDFAAKIVFMRSLNVLMVAAGLVVFRRVLLNAKLTRAMTNTILAFFVLLPLLPQVAAHVNYDNFLLLITPLAVWLAQRIVQAKQLRLGAIAGLLAACMVGSLVKFSFLPIFAALFIYVGVVLLRRHRRVFSRHFSIRTLSTGPALALSLLLVISTALFAERYVVNTVKYKTPAPECNQIQTVEKCLNYAPWARNYENAREVSQQNKKLVGPLNYSKSWGNKMIGDFSVVLGRTAVDQPQTVRGPTGDVMARDGLPIIKQAIRFVLLAGAAATLILIIRLWRNPNTRLFVVVCGVYLLVLWLQNYSDYRHLGVPDGVQGRYLLNILPLLLALMATGVAYLARSRFIKVPLAVVLILAMTQGGGTASYIIRSEPNWYWQNPNIIKINQKAKQVLLPVIKN